LVQAAAAVARASTSPRAINARGFRLIREVKECGKTQEGYRAGQRTASQWVGAGLRLAGVGRAGTVR
jgi:hypothetical protein